MIPANALEKLKALRDKQKFTDPEWDERGLIPSPPDVIQRMTDLTDDVLDALIEDLEADLEPQQIEETLIESLYQIDKTEFDTEEREYIIDTFYNIGMILDIPLDDAIDSWP